jgi:predicted transcriptional regulator
VAHAFTGTVRVVDVAKQVAATDQQTRDALRRLYVLGMVYRERYGRHVGFGMTDLGQQWLDY